MKTQRGGAHCSLLSLTFCPGGHRPRVDDFHICQGINVEAHLKVWAQSGNGFLMGTVPPEPSVKDTDI